MLIIRRVIGQSMLPSLKPGRIVIGRRTHRVKVSDMVIIYHNGTEKIKRVTQIKNNNLFVEGDNAGHSTDSTNFGWLPLSSIIAKVIYPKSPRQNA